MQVAPDIIQLSRIINAVSCRLAKAHIAYADRKFSARHRRFTFQARDSMISLLASFEDGSSYSMLSDPAGDDMKYAMRRIEQAASDLIAAIEGQDGIRKALEEAA